MKTAMPINWHEKCLSNQLRYHVRKKEELDQLQKEMDSLESRISTYKAQIDRAKKLKKDGFDANNFKV